MRKITTLIGLLLALLTGCNQKAPQRIGVDPSFYPLELPGIRDNVYGFTRDLMMEISSEKMMNLTEVTASWDNLEENLRKGKYDAIFTTMPRYNFNLHTYDFSEPYLYVGPILLIRSDSTFHDLKNLRNKEVAIVKESHHDLILEKIPEIIIRTYPDIPSMLQALMDGRVDGAILPILIAEQYVQNLYNGRIKMVQKPLTSEALRLVTLHKENEKMRAAFNHAIKKVKSSGNYNKLLKKYNLINLPLEE